MNTEVVADVAPRFDTYRQLAARALVSLPFGVSAAAISIAVLLLI